MSDTTKLVPRRKPSSPPVLAAAPPPSVAVPENTAAFSPTETTAPGNSASAPSLEELWGEPKKRIEPSQTKQSGLGNNLTTFRWFYVLAVIGTVVFAFFGHGMGEGWPLVFARFGVVLVLTLWGFRLHPSERPEAGYRVQTAGYLEALIGIGAALVPLSLETGDEFRLQKIALPIATSLGTSILGWLLGGELVGGGHRRSSPGGSSASGEMGEFTLRVSEAHDRYLALVERITTSLAQAGQAHLDLVRAANDSGKEGARLAADTAARIRAVQLALGESLKSLEQGTTGGLVASAEDLRKTLVEAAAGLREGMQASRDSTREFTEFLRQAKLLVQGLEEMMKYLANTRGRP